LLIDFIDSPAQLNAPGAKKNREKSGWNRNETLSETAKLPTITGNNVQKSEHASSQPVSIISFCAFKPAKCPKP